MLIIEVSETSLVYDRSTKASLYAASNVAEYWIVDVTGRSVEVLSDPAQGQYGRTRRAIVGDELRPEAFPDVAISVATLFE